jgi:beta-xylosidase
MNCTRQKNRRHLYRNALFALLLAWPPGLQARNPIAPPQAYPADPSAKVAPDGRLYLYCTIDDSTDRYCSYRCGVLSTGDMRNWKWHPDVFVSAGEGDALPENDVILSAPDAQYGAGKYFFYISQQGVPTGVAESDSPTGPFKNVTFLDVGKHVQIDPTTFIDDDGQAYHVWGQFDMKMAKLEPDMRTIVPGSIREKVLTEKEHHFHEGAFMIKRDGLYYVVFADLSRAGRPTCLGYATSKSPTGPYTYRGVIIDNDGCNPGNWNNHGSIAEFGGQWYVFYHRSTYGDVTMRKACVEPIRFLEDGSIPEVEMTTQGAEAPLDCALRIEAEEACLLLGHVRITKDDDAGGILSGITRSPTIPVSNGDRATYKYLDFKQPPKKLRLRVKPGLDDTTISFHPDQPWLEKIAEVTVKGEPNGQWVELVCDASPVTGVHAVVIQFICRGEDGPQLDWWQFE